MSINSDVESASAADRLNNAYLPVLVWVVRYTDDSVVVVPMEGDRDYGGINIGQKITYLQRLADDHGIYSSWPALLVCNMNSETSADHMGHRPVIAWLPRWKVAELELMPMGPDGVPAE